MLEDRTIPTGSLGWSVPIESIVGSPDLNLDPKRFSPKFSNLREQIHSMEHFRLGDVVEIIEDTTARILSDQIYKYVEIQRIGVGTYNYEEMRGWQLPSRARLEAKPGDIFIPHVWGCAGKWFIAAGDCNDLLVTNGCTRIRMKPGKENYLLDLAAGMCSEAFAVQMRGLSTGSDGLAEISDIDLCNVVLPRIKKGTIRAGLSNQLGQVLKGEERFSKAADAAIKNTDYPMPPGRKSHCSLV